MLDNKLCQNQHRKLQNKMALLKNYEVHAWRVKMSSSLKMILPSISLNVRTEMYLLIDRI